MIRTAAAALTDSDVRALRLRAQRLGPEPRRASVGQVVEQVFAVQAQDDVAATLGIWARSDGFTAADVVTARETDRSIVRLWCLRGTLHLVTATDARWLLDLLRPTLGNGNRARRLDLGLDDDTTARGVDALVRALASAGPLTRAEIAEELARHKVPSAGQATIHVIWRASLDGLVCYGPMRAGQATFVLLDDWLPAAPKRDRPDALTELARRFVRAYGPATEADLATWSGLSLGDARRAWATLGREAENVQTPLGPMRWIPSPWATDNASAATRLLPAYDGLWLGYRDRDLLLPRAAWRRISPGGGLIRPAVLVDGEAAGTWTRRGQARATDVVLDAWAPLSAASQRDIEQLVADLGRFLARPTRLVLDPGGGTLR